MAFIAKNPMIAPVADSTPPTPLPGTRGLFPTENGWADIDENGKLVLLAQKKIKSDELDGLNSDNGYVQSEFLVVEEEEGTGHPSDACYCVLTAYYGDDLTENIQYKFNWDGYLSKRYYNAGDILEDGSYEHCWSEWSIIGGGSTKIVDQNYNSNSSNAQSGKAVAQAIAELVNGSPEALDTIYELAKALGDDPNFATTVMNMIGGKADESELEEVVRTSSEINDALALHKENGDEDLIHLTDEEKLNVGKIDGIASDVNMLTLYEIPDMWRTINEHSDIIYDMIAPPITAVPTTLEQNKAYEFGTCVTLSLSFPSTADNGDVIYVSFLSRDIPTNLTVNTTNTTDFDLVPEAHTGYEIYAKYNQSIGCWIVKYSEYSIEGM